MSLVIKNGKIWQGKLVEKDILIENGKISTIGSNLSGEKEIDASGLLVLPGVIDAHVHCRDFEESYKEDFFTVSRSAAKGGITTIFAMPNTKPPVISCDMVEKEHTLAKKSIVNYGLYIGASDDNSKEIKKCSPIVGVKIYLDVTTGNLKVSGEELLNKLFSSHKRIAVHAEGKHVKESINRIPDSSTLYLCHISTKEEIEMLKGKKKNVFCEVTPHHLFLTEHALDSLGKFGTMKPSLKKEEDQEALWKGIKEGIVDTIGTDHAPHTIEEKESCWGVPGLETSLPLMLDAVNNHKLPLGKMIALMSENPAKIFDLSTKGYIKEGFDADLVLVDMHKEHVVTNEEMVSKCSWTPFHGKIVKGWPITTIVNGHVVYNKGQFFENKGKEVTNG